MAEHNYVGQLGESLARKFLEEKGYKILEQNYKTRFAEIDLVTSVPGRLASGGEKLVFVEVRTKVGENFGTPEDTINRQKLWKVLQNAKFYSAFKGWQGPERIDAICIVLRPDLSVGRLTHHENIVS
jgi:putative endonuclease